MDGQTHIRIVRRVIIVILVLAMLDLLGWAAFGYPIFGVGGWIGSGLEIPGIFISAILVLICSFILRIKFSNMNQDRYLLLAKSARITLPALSAFLVSNAVLVLSFQLFSFSLHGSGLLKISPILVLYVVTLITLMYWVIYKFNKAPILVALGDQFDGAYNSHVVWRQCLLWTCGLLIFFIVFWSVRFLRLIF